MTTARVPVAFGVTAVVLLTAALASAQSADQLPSGPPSKPPKELRSVRWTQAVNAHAAGEADEALLKIAAWPHAHTLAVLRSPPVVIYDAPFLQRALTLHTDIAIIERTAFDRQLPPSLVGKVLIVDPTHPDAVDRAFQWSVARMLAQRLVDAAGGAEAARLWYRATSAMLQQWGDSAALGPHLQAAMKLWPDDPVLLLVAGTLHQTFADARVQRYVGGVSNIEQVRSPIAITGQMAPAMAVSIDGHASGEELKRRNLAARIGTADADTELDRAEQAFRRALAADATLAEARVRLAHVQLRRARPADALTTLEPLRDVTLTPALAYYEAMVRGAALDAAGRQRDALAAFEHAAAIRPGAQSARIAISRHMLVDGHPTGALRSLAEAFGPGAERGDDPWYEYFRFHEPDARTLLAGFRAMRQ